VRMIKVSSAAELGDGSWHGVCPTFAVILDPHDRDKFWIRTLPFHSRESLYWEDPIPRAEVFVYLKDASIDGTALRWSEHSALRGVYHQENPALRWSRSAEPPRRADNGASFVYFIRAEPSGLIKIGTATKPRARLKLLQTGSVEVLALVAQLHGGKQVESAWHARFKHLRRIGEWFEPGADLLAAIAAEATAYEAAR
jgi:hypothetical protein